MKFLILPQLVLLMMCARATVNSLWNGIQYFFSHKTPSKPPKDKCLDKTNAEQMFGEIQEAYSVLSNDRKKEIYDTYGHEGLELDQNCCDASEGNKKNFFFQKGFQGTDKSAFDILQGIFKDK